MNCNTTHYRANSSSVPGDPNGQLGVGSIDPLRGPVPVAGLPADHPITQVAAGGAHACARADDGRVFCWGLGDHGQLGNSGFVSSPSPVQVNLPGPAKAIALGTRHGCALLDQGVFCWGHNDSRQLGVSGGDAPDPVQVALPGPVPDAILAGHQHTCAVSAGTLTCWGAPDDARLGEANPATDFVTVPLPDVVQAAGGGRFTCAVTGSHDLWCWGDNRWRNTGTGTATTVTTPTEVTSLHGRAVAVFAGAKHACAVTTDETLACWGDDSAGEVGDGGQGLVNAPIEVSGVTGVTAAALGRRHTCLLADGAVRCFGNDSFGQAGDLELDGPTSPAAVLDTPTAVALAVGEVHSCTSGTAGTSCWGNNSNSQLGNGSRTDSGQSVTVDPVRSYVGLAAGGFHTCGVNVTGDVDCWGGDGNGQLGADVPGGLSSDPVRPMGLPAILSVTCGTYHTCALGVAGSAYCWGSDDDLQLGPVGGESHTPADLGLGGVEDISAGGVHTCLVMGGNVYCFGSNAGGELGRSGAGDQVLQVDSIPGGVSTAVAAGFRHTCSISGTDVWCWGANESGQLGHGTVSPTEAPAPVTGLTGAPLQLSAGRDHTCALTDTGLWCWGRNAEGQLGDGTTISHPDPVLADVSSPRLIGAGGGSTCALTQSGGVLCWGVDSFGQVGDDPASREGTPGVAILQCGM